MKLQEEIDIFITEFLNDLLERDPVALNKLLQHQVYLKSNLFYDLHHHSFITWFDSNGYYFINLISILDFYRLDETMINFCVPIYDDELNIVKLESKDLPLEKSSLTSLPQRNIQALINVLNELLCVIPGELQELLEYRVPCNQAIVNHPTVQVTFLEDQSEQAFLGVLGILNGLGGVCEKNQMGYLRAIYEDQKLIKFKYVA